MSDYKGFTYAVGDDDEVTNYYSADTYIMQLPTLFSKIIFMIL